MHDRFDDLKCYGEITDGHTDWIKKLPVVFTVIRFASGRPE